MLIVLRRSVVLGGAALVGVGAAASRALAAGSDNSSIDIVLPVERGNLDPMLLNTAVKNNYVFAVFNALFSFDKSGALQPGLALGEEVSAGGLIHTLSLRQDVTFHDGSPFTADDVVFSLDRTKNDPRSVNKSYLALVQTATVEGPYKVAIHLSKPHAGLAKALAYLGGIIVPKSYIQKVGEDQFNKAPIGTGPYTFVSDTPGAGLVLHANDRYWSPEKAQIKTVRLRVLTDPNAAIAQLQTGESDFVWSVPPSQVPVLKAAGLVTRATSTQNKIYAQFNVIKYPAYKDVRVAQAFNYGVDRAQIVKAVYPGVDVTLIATLDSPGRRGYDSSITPYPYDPEKAKQLLKEANFNFAQPVTIQVPGTDYDGAQDAAQAMAAQLNQLGLQAKSVVKESASSWDDFRKKLSEPIAFINVPNPYNDPLGPMGAVMLCGQPYSMNCNANFDAEMTAAAALNGAVYDKAVADIDKWLHDNPPGIFLWELPNVSAMSTRLVWNPTQARPWFKLTDFSLH